MPSILTSTGSDFENLIFSSSFSAFRKDLSIFFPDPVKIDGWTLVNSKNNRGKDEPVDIKIKDKKEDKGSYSCQRGEDGRSKQEIRRNLFHSFF